MKQIFEPTQLAGVTLPNRIIRSATFEGMAGADGVPGEDLAAFYARIARGGAGATDPTRHNVLGKLRQ